MTIALNSIGNGLRKRGLRLALVLAAALCLALPAAAADSPTYLKVSNRAMGVTQPVALDVNKSIIVDLPTNVGEVIVSSPAVATAVMRSKTRAIVQGIAGGDTNIFFLDPAGNNIAVLDIKVVQPRSDVGNALEAAIARTIPGSHVKVESVLLDAQTNRVVLSGTALSQDDVTKAISIAVQFAGDPKNVASIISVSGDQQVKLKVTVAERASWAPLPGSSSMQWIVVPTGMLRIGSVLPDLIGASGPLITCCPTTMPLGAIT